MSHVGAAQTYMERCDTPDRLDAMVGDSALTVRDMKAQMEETEQELEMAKAMAQPTMCSPGGVDPRHKGVEVNCSTMVKLEAMQEAVGELVTELDIRSMLTRRRARMR